MHPYLALIGTLGLPEMIVIGIVALLVFGSRLPEVGRSLGRGLMEFKKGLGGIKGEMDAVNDDADRRVDAELERRRQRELAEHQDEPVPEPETIFGSEFAAEDEATPEDQDEAEPSEKMERDGTTEKPADS